MNITLPPKIKVACFDIDIIAWGSSAANARRAYGEFSNEEKLIRIDTTVDRWQVFSTLLHEINHAVYCAYGIQDEDKEERIVDVMGNAWAQIYRDNPHLVEWITTMILK